MWDPFGIRDNTIKMMVMSGSSQTITEEGLGSAVVIKAGCCL